MCTAGLLHAWLHGRRLKLMILNGVLHPPSRLQASMVANARWSDWSEDDDDDDDEDETGAAQVGRSRLCCLPF